MEVKRLLLCLCGWVSAISCLAGNDEVCLRIGDKSFSRADFVRFCHAYQSEHSQASATEMLFDRYLVQQLKIVDAEQCGWDTLPTFRHQCKVAQGKALRRVMWDATRTDSLLHLFYKEGIGRHSMKGWVELEEYSVLLPQRATSREVERACLRMDSVYEGLQRGAAFGGKRTWRPMMSLLQEFTSRLERLAKGEYSTPFVSPLGVHIIRWTDRKPAISYEEAVPYLLAYLDKQGGKNPAIDKALYAAWQRGDYSPAPLANCLQAVRDTLLARWWDQSHPFTYRADEAELEHYFKANKSAYDWEFPHYKGAVIRCADKKMASRIRKYLKKIPQEEWNDAFRVWKSAHPEVVADMQVGLFRIGKNAYVDALAFKCGELPADARYPYACVLGKRLKKGPEDYRDVRGQVERDYRQAQMQRQIDELKQRYKIEISQDVLKTVNCGGSN